MSNCVIVRLRMVDGYEDRILDLDAAKFEWPLPEYLFQDMHNPDVIGLFDSTETRDERTLVYQKKGESHIPQLQGLMRGVEYELMDI